MISLTEYLKDPCGTLSIPYWKNKNIITPEHIKIVHQNDFNAENFSDFTDEKYFRLIHRLENIKAFTLDDFTVRTAAPEDIPLIVDLINKSYTDISVSCEQISALTQLDVYDNNLWIIAYDKENNFAIGCGIADFDDKAKEGILEWIQVLPEYRGNKIGRLIVNELLCRIAEKADFATVSGKVDNASKPEILYRKCGFTGDDVWHILFRKD
ncbi:MAG: GNAT family N-acetyltransferase [Ruminococcus sp.]|nr:GNAT family N-acetyltransferase [Ruminococcus sp.]